METDAYDDDVPVCSSCEDAQKDYARLEGVTNNLAAIVRRLAHAIRDVSPDHDLPGKALDYLKREGFAGQPLRKVGASNTARPPTPTGWSDTDWLKHLQEQHPLPAQGPVDVNVRHGGCLLCAWGNDLPEGEHCRACGCGLPESEVAAKPEESKLSTAVKAARGGDAPIQFKGHA